MISCNVTPTPTKRPCNCDDQRCSKRACFQAKPPPPRARGACKRDVVWKKRKRIRNEPNTFEKCTRTCAKSVHIRHVISKLGSDFG